MMMSVHSGSKFDSSFKLFLSFNLCSLFFILSSDTIRSQVTFEKYYGTPGSNNAGSYFQEVNDGYLISGSENNDGVIFKTDFSGNVFWQQNYSDGTVECLRTCTNDNLLIAGSDYNSPYTAVYRLTDFNGNVIWDTVFNSSPFTRYGISAMQAPDGDFILLENDNYPFQEFLRVRKVSQSSQSTIWTRNISKISNCSPSSMKLTIDSAILITSTSFDLPYPKLVLAKTQQDSIFDWKKEYFYTSDTGLAGNSVVQTSDSGFMVVGYKVFGNPQSDYRLLLMKTDSNGDSLWTKTYNFRNSNAFSDIIACNDGGFAIVGTIIYPPQGSLFDYRVLIFKVDANGDSLWTREYTGHGLSDGRKIHQTTDGGFAIVGTSTDQSANESYIYFIKTDSLGLQSTVDMNSIPENNFCIFPNPASEKIYLNSSLKTQIAVIEIRNLLNQLCFSIETKHLINQSLDISQLKDGYYLLRIITEDKSTIQSVFLKNSTIHK